ncbi:MAG: pilus assembly protein N-terminal domain-containing protein [Pirellulaceae bacterium]
MSTRRILPTIVGAALLLLNAPTSPGLRAQDISESILGTAQPASFTVESASQQIDLPEGSSRNLRFDFKIPELLVDVPAVLQATPISANEIIITGLRPGIAHITVIDPDKKRTIIAINVTIDVRPLELTLNRTFKSSDIKVFPIKDGVMLCGTVSRADDVDNVMAVAKNYFPTTVINQLNIDGAQTVAAQVRVYEVSRNKLRNLGVDWAVAGDRIDVVSGFSQIISSMATASSTQDNFRVGIIDDSSQIDTFINMLEKRNVAKLLSQPTLTAQNGRAAEFLSGGEIPFQVSTGLGTNSIQFRPFGTKLDMVPIIHGQGELTLEIRAEVSEVANDLNAGTTVPGFRVRRVNTAVPMRAGQTLALAGDYREKIETEVKGAPGLLNKGPWGIPFRNTNSQENESELVFMITPQLVHGVDSNQFAGPFPGQTSGVPSNRELFINGHVEVPRCPGDQCPTVSPFMNGDYGAYGHAPAAASDTKAAPANNLESQNTNNSSRGFGYPQSPNKNAGFERDTTPNASQFQPGNSNPVDQSPNDVNQSPNDITPAIPGIPTGAIRSNRNQRYGQLPNGVRR